MGSVRQRIAWGAVIAVFGLWFGVVHWAQRKREGAAGYPDPSTLGLRAEDGAKKEAWDRLAEWADRVGSAETDGHPAVVRRRKDGMTMVLVPRGTFWMGAVPGDAEAKEDESPRHAVEITKPYYMDEHEVTVGMWRRYAVANGVAAPPSAAGETDEQPVVGLTWHEVQPYLAWAGVQLPTEAQWERAARGGRDGEVYPWGSTDDESRRHAPGAAPRSAPAAAAPRAFAPVKRFPANAYGLHGMCGNAPEWCRDLYVPAFYAASPPRDPVKEGRGMNPRRVLRGGCGSRTELRSSHRGHEDAEGAGGFRCVREVSPIR